MIKLCIFLSLFSFNFARAEYRVYQYVVSNQFKENDKEDQIIRSTLDPISYVAYHGGRSSVRAQLLRTWICPGYTGDSKPFCDSPYRKLASQAGQL